MKTLITTCTALAFASALCLAEDKPAGPPPGGPGGDRPRPNPEEMFKKMDTNGDGSVSLEEFKENPRAKENPDRATEAFKRMDKDNDGKVTLEEFKSGRPPGGPRGPGGPGGGGPGGPGGGNPKRPAGE